MIKNLSVQNFKGVSHLETSQLMTHAKGHLEFSTTKANVIVGPNGAGKSALLSALSLRYLASQTGISSFDDKYVTSHDSDDLWSCEESWSRKFKYLEGLTVVGDNAPALYYRPNHIPGNDHSVAASMMCGYFTEARAYGAAVDKKSSGEGNKALLTRIRKVLTGEPAATAYARTNWRYGDAPRDLRMTAGYAGSYDYKAEILKTLFADVSGVPLILMDEPEQSLDALSQTKLWHEIAAADYSRLQVIVATHSLYPLMYPKAFNLIEAVPGYIQQVLAELSN